MTTKALLTKNSVFHERTKYIDVRYHFVKDVVSEWIVDEFKVSIEENLTDMLTKT